MDVFAQLLPVLATVLVALLLSVGMLVAGKLLGPRRPGAVKQMPYESGMDPIHDTRRRFDVRFYMVAIAFLIFDVELLFLYPWAVARTNDHGLKFAVERLVGEQQELGQRGTVARTGFAFPIPGEATDAEVADRLWIVFVGVQVFLAVLVWGYVYDWRKGLFQWR